MPSGVQLRSCSPHRLILGALVLANAMRTKSSQNDAYNGSCGWSGLFGLCTELTTWIRGFGQRCGIILSTSRSVSCLSELNNAAGAQCDKFLGPGVRPMVTIQMSLLQCFISICATLCSSLIVPSLHNRIDQLVVIRISDVFMSLV